MHEIILDNDILLIDKINLKSGWIVGAGSGSIMKTLFNNILIKIILSLILWIAIWVFLFHRIFTDHPHMASALFAPVIGFIDITNASMWDKTLFLPFIIFWLILSMIILFVVLHHLKNN